MANLLKLMIDSDGVCADFVGGVIKRHNTLYPFKDHALRSDVVSYNFDGVLEDGELHDIMNLPNFFLDLDILPGVMEYLPKIVERGHSVKFVTKLPVCVARDNTSILSNRSAEDKFMWFERNIFSHIPKLSRDDLVLVFDKSWLQHNFDIAFEDHVDQLVGFECTRVLYDTSYNKTFIDGTKVNDFAYNIRRVGVNCENAWEEFYKIVLEHEED